ncbi:MAG: oligopeptide transporter, OPT family [Bacteroidetes bacterium]|nr:oligopeptide transporter, OPT family [Bacteroidota bacterium]
MMEFTADGSVLVSVGASESGQGSQLWTRRWADLDAAPIRGTEGVTTFALSPDGGEIAFVAGFPAPLRVVAPEGGASRTLLEQVYMVADWAPDGTVYFQRSPPVFSLAAIGGGGEAVEILRTERDTPINYVLIGTAALAVPIFIVFMFVINQDELGITTGLYLSTILFGVVFAFIAGFLFSSVAGYMAGLVGSSNNPISGVTIATILTISLILLLLLGSQIDFAVDTTKATAAAAVAILVGAVVCCAAAIAGDNMQDLKAGQLVGATPYKQQIMQIVGVVAAAVTIAPVLNLLFQAYGLGDVLPHAGMDPSEALQAPQATLMSAVAEGVFLQNLPWTMIWIGVVIAGAIIALDEVLKKRGSSFRTPVLAVAVGIYLPLELTVPIFVGGIIALGANRYLAARKDTLGEEYEQVVARSNRRGLLFAAGLITGEALVGILLAIPFAAAQNTDVLRLAPEGFETVANILGVAAFVFFCLWLYRVARQVHD